jgi:cystathionine beta-synthase
MSPNNLEPLDNILQAIGWTPLVRLNRIARGIRTPVYVKAENLNPGGSVKDRIGVEIIEAAERKGDLKAGGTVVEATSGNTGVGLALACAIKGYRCVFTIPDKMSTEKVRAPARAGAEVIVVPTAVRPDHPEYYINKARAIVASTPGAIMADQHYNPANPEAHYRTTGPEIWEQTKGKVTHFVCSPGTGGTISGAGRLPQGEERGRARDRRRSGRIHLHGVRATHHKGRGLPVQGGRDREGTRSRRRSTSTSSTSGRS